MHTNTHSRLRHYSPLTCNLGRNQVENKIFSVWANMEEIRYTVWRLCLFSWGSWRWRTTYRSTVYALVVEESFLQSDFLRSDLLPCHILSAAGNRKWVKTFQKWPVLQHCYSFHTQESQRSLPVLKLMLFILHGTSICWICPSMFYLSIHPRKRVTWSRSLPWCPQGGSPPPSSPAASSQLSPGCFPPEASAPSPAGVSSPAESRSFWAACCCAGGSEAASPPQTSSACVLKRKRRNRKNIHKLLVWIISSSELCLVLLVSMSHLLALYEAWPVRLPTAAPLGLQLYHRGRAGWRRKKQYNGWKQILLSSFLYSLFTINSYESSECSQRVNNLVYGLEKCLLGHIVLYLMW